MKKSLLILFLASTLVTLSQTEFNRAYHSKNEGANPCLVAINGDLYSTTRVYDFPGGCYIYKHNSSGVLQFKKPVTCNGFGFKTLDNMLLLTNRPIPCDVVMATQVNCIQKIDNSGTAVFTATNLVAWGDNIKAAIQRNDSSYYAFTDSVMFRYTKTGQFVSKTNLGLTNIASAIALPNGNILISAQQGNMPKLLEIGATGSILSSNSQPGLLSKMMFYGGQNIMGLGGSGLVKVSSNHDFLSVGIFTNVTISDFTVLNDSVYCIYSAPGVSSGYLACNSSFVSFNTANTLTNRISQVAITSNLGKVVVLSNGASKTAQSIPEHYFTVLNSFNKMGSNNFHKDIALLSVLVDSAYTSCYSPSPLTVNGQVCTAFARVKIKVRNTGNSPVSRFKLNSFNKTGVACGDWYNQEQFSGFSLEPGDSITLTATTFAENYLDLVSGPTVNVTYCFYTSVPDDEADAYLANNDVCKTIAMFATSLTEQSPDLAEQVLIYPNPLQNSLNIESSLEIRETKIYDMLGALIKTEDATGKPTRLDTYGMPAGIYVVKLQTPKGELTKKIVKE